MSLNNVEEFGTSLPDVESMEIQILEKYNDASVQQKFNASICSGCNKDTKDGIYFTGRNFRKQKLSRISRKLMPRNSPRTSIRKSS